MKNEMTVGEAQQDDVERKLNEKQYDEVLKIFAKVEDKDFPKKVKKLLKTVRRKGMEEVIVYLETYSDFFKAPASSNNHCCYEGGLMEHSYNVFFIFFQKNIAYGLGLSLDSVIITSIFHDMCKSGLYKKNPDGTYTFNKEIGNRGHGTLSVERVKRFEKFGFKILPVEEAMIKYHQMLYGVYGYFANKVDDEYSPKELYDAIKKYPVVQVFASSDAEATLKEDYKEKVKKFRETKVVVPEEKRVKPEVTKKNILMLIQAKQQKGKGLHKKEIYDLFGEENAEAVQKLIEKMLTDGDLSMVIADHYLA